MKKYYEAYNDRYIKVHQENLLWFSEAPTQELLEWVEDIKIPIGSEICEFGCGEGRDAIALGKKGYRMTGIDIAEEAIRTCKRLSHKENIEIIWHLKDATEMNKDIKAFEYVYTVGTLHMLVETEDRIKFLKTLFHCLKPKGHMMLMVKGDGVETYTSNIEEAFELQRRTHMKTGQEFMLAGTSFRAVTWDHLLQELVSLGFLIERKMDRDSADYGPSMVVYLTRE